MEQFGSYWTDLHENLYLSIFLESCEKIQVLLKFDKENGYFIRKLGEIYEDTSLNYSVCRSMWKTIVEPGRSQMTI